MGDNLPFETNAAQMPRARKGVDPAVAQQALDKAAKEYGELHRCVAELQARVAELENERATVNNVLILAQKSAEEIVRKAHADAETALAEGRARAQAMDDEHRAALRELQSDLEQVTVMRLKFADDFRALLRGYLAELDARFPPSSPRMPEMPTVELAVELPEPVEAPADGPQSE